MKYFIGFWERLCGMLGLSLSFNTSTEKMHNRAIKLAHKGNGESKFLESMIIWIDITASRYWWCQLDTYRIATKQSQSTMHTITKRHLQQSDFENPVPEHFLEELNARIDSKDLEGVKNILPEGFLQRRILCCSYKTFQNMYFQRKTHKLPEWSKFLDTIVEQLDHPEFVVKSE